MIKYLLFICLLIGKELFSFAQNNLTQPITCTIIQKPDIEALLKEDAFNSGRKDIPYRYGVPFICNLDIIVSGNKEEVGNRYIVYRHKFIAPEAKTLELKFNKFYLPVNSELLFYNHTGTVIINRFTSENNRNDLHFSSGMIYDTSIVIEYILPLNAGEKGLLNIEKVIYGYKSISDIEKLGDCYININCSLGNNWQNEKRAVARVTLGSGSYCTGTLVNNTRHDGQQYFLTANHCYEASTDVQNWDFYFNYETPTCTGITPYIPAVGGATLKAKSSWSDFCLLEISSAIPQSMNAYFAGWTNFDTASNFSTIIHHPGGSSKKISQDYDPLVSGSWSTTPDSHWYVLDYDTSSTEGGSSGSAIFNENHKIVGQLQGGNALCDNNSWDAYGKFSMSWNYGGSSATRLKEWLDPDNSGITTIEGWDPDVPNDSIDAQLLNILNPTADYCTAFDNSPALIIRNLGAKPLTNLLVHYKFNNDNVVTQTWSGNLIYLQTDTFYFQTASFPSGTHTFKAFLSNPNNTSDEFLFNDTITININGTAGEYFELDLKARKYYEDAITWSIKNSNNQVLYSGGPYDTPYPYIQLHITQNFCLPDDCYTFTITDNNCGGTTPGRYYFTNITAGDTIGSGCNTGTTDVIPFCINITDVINENFAESENNQFSFSENIDKITIFLKPDYTVDLFDVSGRTIRTFKNIEIVINKNELSAGIYFLRINTPLQFVKKIIK